MAKIYSNSMAEKAGLVEVYDENEVLLTKFQAVLDALSRTDYGDNSEYIVEVGDTWQNIALRHLGTAELWWVIAEFNRSHDAFDDLVPGKRIIIPAATRVRLAFDQLR